MTHCRYWFCLVCLLLAAAVPAWAADSAKISPRLQPFVETHTLAGAVTLVASKDKVLSLEAVGWADIANRQPMKTDAMFWIASQSKPMTAAALMMLVDEGKVNLDDPVEKYLPEFKGQMLAAEQDHEHVLLKKPSRPIMVREVLSHLSGLPFSSRLERGTNGLKIDALTLREAALSYAMTPLNAEPGTKHDYSNAGINTAGRIIEVVSGMPYKVFMERRLFKPLGMKETTFWPTAAQVKRIAKAYRPNAAKNDLEETKIDQLTYPLSDPRRGPSPAGGYFSTARDMARFCQMLLNNGTFEGRRYLTEEAVKEMTRKQGGDAIKQRYGFGLSLGDGSFGHGGAYATNMTIDQQHGLVLIYMVQHAGYPGPDGGKIQPAFSKAAVELFGK